MNSTSSNTISVIDSVTTLTCSHAANLAIRMSETRSRPLCRCSRLSLSVAQSWVPHVMEPSGRSNAQPVLVPRSSPSLTPGIRNPESFKSTSNLSKGNLLYLADALSRDRRDTASPHENGTQDLAL